MKVLFVAVRGWRTPTAWRRPMETTKCQVYLEFRVYSSCICSADCPAVAGGCAGAASSHSFSSSFNPASCTEVKIRDNAWRCEFRDNLRIDASNVCFAAMFRCGSSTATLLLRDSQKPHSKEFRAHLGLGLGKKCILTPK